MRTIIVRRYAGAVRRPLSAIFFFYYCRDNQNHSTIHSHEYSILIWLIIALRSSQYYDESFSYGV